MPHDLDSSDDRPGNRSIGFHELRQACEISALKETLERVALDTEALRDTIESRVEDVRRRFAALSTEDLADSTRMAPLLEQAVTSLLEIREQARTLNAAQLSLPDEDRPSWVVPETARPLPAPPAPAARPPAPAPMVMAAPVRPVEPAPAARPVPSALAAAPPPAPAPAPPPTLPSSWLATASGPAERGAARRAGAPPFKGVDWFARG